MQYRSQYAKFQDLSGLGVMCVGAPPNWLLGLLCSQKKIKIILAAARPASKVFSVVAQQEKEGPKERLEIQQCRGECVLMRINQDSRSWGGSHEPDATVQPLNDSAVAVTEMQCNGRTGSFVSTPRAATGTGVYTVRCHSYDDQWDAG